MIVHDFSSAGACISFLQAQEKQGFAGVSLDTALELLAAKDQYKSDLKQGSESERDSYIRLRALVRTLRASKIPFRVVDRMKAAFKRDSSIGFESRVGATDGAESVRAFCAGSCPSRPGGMKLAAGVASRPRV